jgi:drug/metabolite transporter (DMT)-like permease
MQKPSLLEYMLLWSVGLIWGSQFIFHKWALKAIPPLTVATGRILIGALTLTLLAKISTPATPVTVQYTSRLWRQFGWISLFEAVLPFFLIAWGQQHVDSSITAILMGSIPLFTLVFAVSVGKEKWHVSSVISILVGFIGLIILIGPTHSTQWQNHILGELAILAGSMSFAMSIVMMKKLPKISPLFAIRHVLGIAALPMLVLCCLIDKPWQLHMTASSLGSLMILGIFCTGIVYLLFLLLIQRTGSTFASLINYLVPLVGVILGISFLGEKLAMHEIVALAIITLALFINRKISV